MPITALHTWEEDELSFTINLLITGVSRGSLDIFASDCFIKVNAQPYLFQVDLKEYIDELKSSAAIESSGIRIRAIKVSGNIISFFCPHVRRSLCLATDEAFFPC